MCLLMFCIWMPKVYKAWTDVSERKAFWSYFVFIDFLFKIKIISVAVYVVILQLHIKTFSNPESMFLVLYG